MPAPLRSAAALAVLALAALPARAQPDAFWCGTHLIREGMRAGDIARYCGEPVDIEVREEPIMARYANGNLHQVGVKTIEFWHYDRGTRSFPARIAVEDGIATAVELLRGN